MKWKWSKWKFYFTLLYFAPIMEVLMVDKFNLLDTGEKECIEESENFFLDTCAPRGDSTRPSSGGGGGGT